MRPLHLYMFGTGTWFFAFGVQAVLFAWLVTMVLGQPAEKVGLAQMAMLLPGTALILVGGSIADRVGGRNVAMIAQTVAGLAPLLLMWLIWSQRLTYETMLAYAVVMGCAQAFVTPARDGLLNQVAGERLQRAVMLTTLIQFGAQIIGFGLASLADRVGPIPILFGQALILWSGVYGFSRISHARNPQAKRQRLWTSIAEGARTVLGSPTMRVVALQNVAMALFFMGSYIVSAPLLVRDVYGGGASDLSLMNASNSIGMVLTLLLLLRLGDITRPGRALLLAHAIGAIALMCVGVVNSWPLAVLFFFLWGVCGGVAMPMSRSMMQELAPPEQRGRVMSFFAFAFMGAGPIGALLSGYLVEHFGARTAIAVSGASMAVVVLVVTMLSRLWHVSAHAVETPTDVAATNGSDGSAR